MPSRSGLIGRERELRELVEAAIARPSLTLICGQAGVGKSALVREALADRRLREACTLVGHCHRMREPFPLGPVVEALCALGSSAPRSAFSPVVGALAPVMPELASMLPPRPAPLGDARAERHRIFRALRELLAGFGPVVCVLEDLHWADESTLEFLEFLACDPPRDVVLVLTYRSDELPAVSSLPALAAALPAHVRRATIDVPPLSVEEVGRLCCALLATSGVSQELAQHLHEQTAGIPFAVEEVVRLHRGQLELVDGWRTVEELDRLGVPPAVRQSLRERMAPLPSDAWLVIRAVAVLGAPAGEELVGKVSGITSVRTIKALGRALSVAVLEERADGLYGFLHALAAQAVYDEIPGPERRWLHRRAAEALQAGPEPLPLAQLAHHFREAGRARLAAQYAEAAADAASSIGDDRAAARLLEQALCAGDLPRASKLRIAAKLGWAAVFSATPARALELLERVAGEEPMAPEARGELRYRIARLRYQTGDTGPWREQMAEAIAHLQRRPSLAAQAMVTLASPVVGQGPVEDDLAWLDRAVEAAARSGDAAVRAGVAGQRAVILLCVGDREAWRAVEQIPWQEGSISDKLALLRTYQSLAGAAIGPGHFFRAECFLREVERLLAELPHVAWQPWLASARASLDWRTGRWEGLEPRLRELSERGTGGPGLATGNEMIHAALLLSHGRIRDAEQSFRSILERAVARRWMGSHLAAATGLARILLARGEARAAAEMAASGVAVLERKRIWIWGRELLPVAVQALLASGDPHAAAALAERFSAAVADRDSPAAQAAAHLCRGFVAGAAGRHASAAQQFAGADRISRALPAPYEAARARAAHGRCLLAAGDRNGVEVLLGAVRAFDDLGATWDASRVRAEFRSRGLPPPVQRHGGRRPYGDELSPREAEVAQLAALGHKNREIARTLFISQRTVETHVAAALRKLGARSRDALADALAEQRDESVTASKNP
ncbi:MAG TPA: AAA family ATPase [Solirubrobacteraceae bacterium]|nr:AAA family ATPase [Solirubrobacteraceae bacterium]